MDKVGGIIVAAGRGERMGAAVNKVYLPLRERPLLLYSLQRFETSSEVDCYCVVASPEEVSFCRTLLAGYRLHKLSGVVPGGQVRQESVAAGLAALPGYCTLVAVHDGARPLLTQKTLDGAINMARECGAVIVAVPVKDTVKEVAEGTITGTPERRLLWAAQTPQIFRRSLLEKALARARQDHFLGTDDASLVERIGEQVAVFPGSYDNLKVTTPGDLVIAAALLPEGDDNVGYYSEGTSTGAGVRRSTGRLSFPRSGIGYDVHTFAGGRRLVLGGVEIPEGDGLAGHSDADVLVHALMDALLGAAGLPDIGHYFPPADPRWQEADSLALLAIVKGILAGAGFLVGNVDLVVAAERPRLAPYIDLMKERIAALLGVPADAVGIKATTCEGLGFVGRKEGIAAWATATLLRERFS